MKIVFLISLLFGVVFGDFFIVSGNQKVKMTPLSTGKIDFATFDTIATIERGNNELHAMGEEVAFNHKHLNFRLSTIDLTQTNYSLGEWSKQAQESANTHYISFDGYTRIDGVMLQLFYKNNWYSVVLGEPLKILQNLFSKLDMNEKNFDVTQALVAVKQARTAFPNDEILKNAEIKLEEKRANDTNNPSKYSSPDNKPVKVFFN